MPREFNAQRVHDDVMSLIEFAWISGLLRWTAKEYESAAHLMFAKKVDAKKILERAKFAQRKDEDRSRTFKALAAFGRDRDE